MFCLRGCSRLVCSSSLMATKPHRLHQIVAGATLQGASKKPRTLMVDSAMQDGFSKYAEYLNELNDKRERIVKASRDVTINSKKVIFQVHRISRGNKEEVLANAENDLANVTKQYMSKLVKELQGTDFWKLRRAYTFGVQEYVEAATLCNFCKTGTLLNLSEINASLLPLSDPSIEPLQINVLDYILGIADLTGELMRLAIGRISDGEVEYAKKICSFVRDIYRELTLLVPIMEDNADMKKKMETMLQSVVKIENACYSVHVRGSEYIPLLGTNDPDFSLFGAADFEP
ncbi:LOW QUALITY PROTEIN: translin-associated protein X [Dioscorea cayenensis subsp. rotundata]|uniref:LOW QUALITY PROTEIN: translin-associated protein X n=1 Tax=Dioscorea cayennensis subsp. rotundata TaxID=55577 RepID=A0AB40BKU7_DIOCR|nr:LOW QUALITY PROTEIN: translin-associated protein X [Dioscorea cayenensis subsp. rotundata]